MGGMDGLQAGRQLAEMDVPPAIIFQTAYSEHALSAFDANVQASMLTPTRLAQLRDDLQRSSTPPHAQKPQLANGVAQPLQRTGKRRGRNACGSTGRSRGNAL